MEALTLPTTPAERFAWILGALRRAVAAQSAAAEAAAARAAAGRPVLARPAHLAHHVALVLTAPLFRVLWARLGRIAARFARLAARIPAGAPPRPSTTRPSITRPFTPQPHTIRPLPPAPPPLSWAHLPRRPGWLARVVPPPLCPARSQLQHLLADPDMAALLAASPGLRRTLRPLCRMLALPPPPEPPQPGPPQPGSPQPGSLQPATTPAPAPTPAATAAARAAGTPAATAAPPASPRRARVPRRPPRFAPA